VYLNLFIHLLIYHVMKRFTFLVGFFFCVILLYSQSQRLVLLEQFTQASCGPCAQINPTIENLLNSNPTEITSVWYHTSWPGYDPMNLHNPIDPASRVALYMSPSNQYVPYSVLDGNFYNGSANGWNINNVNTRAAVPSPFELHTHYYIPSTNDSVYLTMLAKCTQNVSGQMTAQNIVIETNIHFNSPPGSNGEKDFKNVCDKMLPDKYGTTIATSYTPGDYEIVETSWKFQYVYDVTKVSSISFIQNKSSKEIHQSCNGSTDPLVMPYNDDLQVLKISNIPYTNCGGTFSPVVKIRNNGNNAVTSFHIKYKVNDEALNDYTWSGNLNTLQKSLITLPELTFTPLVQNTFTIYTVNPNNVADQYPKNDTLRYNFAGAPITSETLYFRLFTDNNPEQTTWDIKNSGGTIVASGGPYALSGHLYNETIQVTSPDCYVFTIHDSGGDGICCANGSGTYILVDANNSDLIIAQGASFTTSESGEFRIIGVGIQSHEMNNVMSVFPNPFNGKTTVSYWLPAQDNVTFSVYNSTGQLVRSEDLGTLQAGKHEFFLESNGLPSGIYLLELKAGSKDYTRKISITK
jgi:hypothetical protein